VNADDHRRVSGSGLPSALRFDVLEAILVIVERVVGRAGQRVQKRHNRRPRVLGDVVLGSGVSLRNLNLGERTVLGRRRLDACIGSDGALFEANLVPLMKPMIALALFILSTGVKQWFDGYRPVVRVQLVDGGDSEYRHAVLRRRLGGICRTGRNFDAKYVTMPSALSLFLNLVWRAASLTKGRTGRERSENEERKEGAQDSSSQAHR
jgi:hypothetical protein